MEVRTGFEPAFDGFAIRAHEMDPLESRGFSDPKCEAAPATMTPKCAEARETDESRTKPGDPRAALVGALADGMRAALAAGDMEAARIAHETIGRLLGAPSELLGGVVDLAAERARRR
jgi:hypothetical protein